MFTIRSGWFLGALCALAASCGAAIAQESTPGDTPLEERPWEPGRWRLQLEPAVWWAAMGGDVRVGEGASAIDFEDFSGDADDPHAAFSLRTLYRKDRWTVMVDGFYFGFDEGDPATPAGSLDFSLWSVDTSVGYTVWERTRERYEVGKGTGGGAAVRLIPYAGFRALGADLTIDSGGGPESESESFLHPIVGARIEVEVLDRLSFDTGIDAGGFDLLGEEAFTLDWTVGLRFHPVENVAVQIGFRQMFMDIESDALRVDGTIGGLMAGVTIRF